MKCIVGQWGFFGCITELRPAAKKGTRLGTG